MDNQERKSARSRTLQALGVAYIAFLLGGYATRFSWDHWAATAIAGAALAGFLFVLIRDFWRPGAAGDVAASAGSKASSKVRSQ
jgi:hypothetical protein